MKLVPLTNHPNNLDARPYGGPRIGLSTNRRGVLQVLLLPLDPTRDEPDEDTKTPGVPTRPHWMVTTTMMMMMMVMLVEKKKKKKEQMHVWLLAVPPG